MSSPTNYHSIVADAVAKLGNQSSVEARRAVYARGRSILLARLNDEQYPWDGQSAVAEKAAYENACLDVEAAYVQSEEPGEPNQESGTTIKSLARDLLLHLFGEDGYEKLRRGNWRFISVIAPVFGFFADICTVFAHSATILLGVFVCIGVALAIPVWFRTRFCEHCAMPCVFALILAIAFGFVVVTQKAFAAEDAGVVATYIPGARELQATISEVLGLQKATLSSVERIKADTTTIRQQLSQNTEQLSRINILANEAIVQRLLSAASVNDPGEKQALRRAVLEIAQAAESDVRYGKALELLSAGKPEDAEKALLVIAEEKSAQAERNSKDAAAAFVNLASIAMLSDFAKARAYYQRAAQLDSSNAFAVARSGWFEMESGQLDQAEHSFSRALQVGDKKKDGETLVYVNMGLGLIHEQRGEMTKALSSYGEATKIAQQLVKDDPKADHQVDLATCYQRLGNLLAMHGDLNDAMGSLTKASEIAIESSKSQPDNILAIRVLSLSFQGLGDIFRKRNDLLNASTFYEKALVIAKRFAEADPDNPRWQMDVAEVNARVGDLRFDQKDYSKALVSYQAVSSVWDKLASNDPDNNELRRDQALSYARVGDVYRMLGNSGAAQESFGRDISLMQSVAASAPNNLEWQRDLSFSHQRLGSILSDQGRVDDAIIHLGSSVTILEQLVKIRQDNSVWAGDLADAYSEIASALIKKGSPAKAIEFLSTAVSVRNQLVRSFPDNEQLQRALALSYVGLAGAYDHSRQLPKERAALLQSRAMLRGLQEQHPESALFKGDLSTVEQLLAKLSK